MTYKQYAENSISDAQYALSPESKNRAIFWAGFWAGKARQAGEITDDELKQFLEITAKLF